MNDNLILDMDAILRLQDKASKLDAIIAYISSCKYSPDNKIIFAIAGREDLIKEE